MIVKRFEQGEEIDLTFMFGELIKVVNQKVSDGSIGSK